MQNLLGYGCECGICNALGKFLDEVAPLLQALGKLGIQGNRTCNNKSQERADKMVEWVKVLAAKPAKPGSVSRTYMLGDN